MGYNLFLDDIRMPEDVYNYTGIIDYNLKGWVIVRNYDDFVLRVKCNDLPDIISFDHDLGLDHYEHQNTKIPYDEYEEKTGYHCAKWLIDYCLNNNIYLSSKIYIHSMNTVGAKNIESLFKSYYKIYKK